MKIKDKLALNFTLIGTGMLLIVLASVYYIFSKFLEADFYSRLNDRTMVTANLYLEADEISKEALDKVRSRYLEKLNHEIIRIYDSNNKATFIGDGAQYWNSQTINNIRKSGKIKFKNREYQAVGIFYKDNQGDFVIIASAIDQGSHQRLNKLFKIMLATFLICSILLLLSGRWMARKILQPLHFFMEQVKKVGSSNLEFRVKDTQNKDEIDELAKSFNRLLEELEQAFILQKTFVSNASHELRTPITRMMMTTELALAKERAIPEYKSALESVLEDNIKINSIITGLLTLAKSDLQLATANLSSLNLMTILKNIRADWHTQHGFELKILDEKINTEQIVSVNRVLLEIALNNIIANAYKFSNQNIVECWLESNQEYIKVYLKDTGTGIADEDIEFIFKPLYSKANLLGKEGDGMGLYMAAKIISLFKGEIKVISEIGVGSTFIVSLPQF